DEAASLGGAFFRRAFGASCGPRETSAASLRHCSLAAFSPTASQARGRSCARSSMPQALSPAGDWIGRNTRRPQLGQQYCPSLPCQILPGNTSIRLLGNAFFHSKFPILRKLRDSSASLTNLAGSITPALAQELMESRLRWQRLKRAGGNARLWGQP